MVRALDSGPSGLGGMGGVIVLCCWERHCTFTVPSLGGGGGGGGR